MFGQNAVKYGTSGGNDIYYIWVI